MKLKVIRFNDNEPEKPIFQAWKKTGGTIGRKPDNDWVLPDKKCHLSGHHAVIEFKNGEYHLSDTSSNGVFLNGASSPLGKDNPYRLSDGDVIRMGEYEIAVELESPSNDNKNEELLDLPGVNPEQKKSSRWDDHPFKDVISGEAEESKYADHISVNVADRVIALPEVKKKESHSVGGFTPAEGSFSSKKHQQEEVLTHQDITEEGVMVSKGKLNSEAITDFLEGAGLSNKLGQSDFQQHLDMKSLGNLFRIVVTGTTGILNARNEIKSAMGMDVTIVQRINNNPLKLPMGTDDVISKLLSLPEQGFLSPEKAFQEAFDDIGVHQMAVIAGVQAALKQVLKRFDPSLLVERLEKDNPIGAMIPTLRQAKLWELFAELYTVIEDECQDDFHRLFGVEFIDAYEKQIAQIRQQNQPANMPVELVLSIVNLSDITSSQTATHAWSTKGGTIGRLEHNDWVLLDPTRRISRSHAKISFRNGGFIITDTSSWGVFINHNDEKVGRGNSCSLKEGDIVQIGHYEISVALRRQEEDATEPGAPGNIPHSLIPENEKGRSEGPSWPLGTSVPNMISPQDIVPPVADKSIESDAQISDGPGWPIEPSGENNASSQDILPVIDESIESSEKASDGPGWILEPQENVLGEDIPPESLVEREQEPNENFPKRPDSLDEAEGDPFG